MKRMLFFLLVVYSVASAQVKLPVPRNVEQLYNKGTRSADGRPGKNYWQNDAAYNISINFNPATRELNGLVNISYSNNSPDTLHELLLKLYPNIYKKGNIRMMPVEASDLTDGVNIVEVIINGSRTEGWLINGTNMQINGVVVNPLEKIQLSLKYHYILNQKSHIRTGEIEKGADFIAYFFPRIAVYDDLDGWNRYDYTGPQEFYNDFCNFNVLITVPADYLVWATGDLQNCGDVLNDTFCKRMAAAEKSSNKVFIVDENDLAAGNITKPGAMLTWQFTASNVVDFAFAVSDHYLWNATSVEVDSKTHRRTRVDAVFDPKHRDYYEVIDFARQTVDLMSNRFPKWPFPYSHISVFDGLDQMEYPMMVNDNPLESRQDVIMLTTHEIFHTMFPFYMGTNETKYGWMDEGWATIGEWLLCPLIDTTLKDDYGIARTEANAGNEIDAPVVSLTTQLNGTAMFLNSYPKPALGYLYVKDMLGDSVFLKALHFYISEWNGKHPLPLDFFNCMNTGSGKNLNWFWKRWFYESGYPDLGIAAVKETGNKKQLSIVMKGSKPVPVDVTVTFEDGSKQQLHRSIAVWEKTGKLVLSFTAPKKIRKVELGSLYTVDVNKADNTWIAK